MLDHIPDDPFRPLHLNGVETNQSNTIPSKDDADAMVAVVPVAIDAPEPSFQHPRFGRPNQAWPYTDATGAIHHYRVRFDPPDQRKQVLPYSLWRRPDGTLKWRFKAIPGLQPLYRLEALSADPCLAVVVVEGEKCADAAQVVFPSDIVVTSPGGAGSVASADWSVLADRDVVIWPDLDEAGQSYADRVAQILQGTARSI
jgi:hypothetical protein